MPVLQWLLAREMLAWLHYRCNCNVQYLIVCAVKVVLVQWCSKPWLQMYHRMLQSNPPTSTSFWGCVVFIILSKNSMPGIADVPSNVCRRQKKLYCFPIHMISWCIIEKYTVISEKHPGSDCIGAVLFLYSSSLKLSHPLPGASSSLSSPGCNTYQHFLPA